MRLAIVLKRLAGVLQHVDDTGAGDRLGALFLRPLLVLGALAGIDGGTECGAVRLGRTGVVEVITLAEATAGQADLADHAGHGDEHPRPLLAMMLALRGPAGNQHRAAGDEAAGKLADLVGGNLALLGRPLRRLLDLVPAVALQVLREFLEAEGVVLDEVLVVDVLG